MKWRLALDMGTNSIGWAALELSVDGSPSQMLDMGVRVFSDSRKAKDGTPLNEERRICRQMRRQKERRIRRKRAMLSFCIQNKLLPDEETKRKPIAQLDPYKLRAEALQRKLEPYELGRIFMHLANRRGFKSSRKEQLSTTNTELSGIKAGVERLAHQLQGKTLGTWLYEQQCQGNPVRFRPRNEGTKIIYDLYPSREMYETEFKTIQERQIKYFPHINWERAHWLIFFQRPLKRPERGKCQFYTTEDRGYKALPSAHRFRIAQEVNNLAYYDNYNRLCEIPHEIKSMLIQKLDTQKAMSFDKIRSLLGNNFTGIFNLESERRKELKGNSIAVDFRKSNYFGSLWDSLSWEEQDEIIEMLIIEEDEEKLKQFLKKYNVNDENISAILGYNFETGTTMLSGRFMRDCARIMQEKLIPYHEAVVELGFHHSKEEQPEIQKKLPYYGQVLTALVQNAHGELPKDRKFPNKQAELEYMYGRIANPTVHVALNQLRKLVNALINRFGHPEEIILEVARELKLPRYKKAEIEREQTENQKKNDRAKEELIKLGLIAPSKEDIKKYLLWEELAPEGIARGCPYCGKPISATQLLSNDIEIEHILPYSKTLLNTRDNLTVAHRQCNQVKGQRTPYEAFASNPEGFNWEDIVSRIQRLPSKKRIKFNPNALKEFQEENQFLQKQLTDNAYISRSAKQYLAAICNKNKIWVSTGRLTAMLRGKWGLNTLLNSTHDTWFKNRSDHRHHAIDALTIGLCDRGLINTMARLNSGKGYAELTIPEFPFNREVLQERIKSMVVSSKLDHGKEGKIFKETAMGKIKKIITIPPQELQEDRIPHIIPPKIRQQVENLCKEKSFNDVKKILPKRFTHFYIAEEYWVATCPITALSESDIKEGRIVDPDIRTKLQEYFEQNRHLLKLSEILHRFSVENNIYNIRYTPKDQVPVQIPTAPYKAYMPADYYRVDIWAIPQKNKPPKYEGVYISRAMAYLTIRPPKPHPAARFIMSLHKGDVILITNKNNSGSLKEYALIGGYSTTQNKIDIQPLFASGSIQEWIQNTNPELVSNFWPKDCEKQNYKSINVLFSEYNIRQVKITVDGRVFIR
ncbi:MAG: type II CRISPR RNA-guided endonuclease Cas9 [Treponemataceae bacterium]|nr:type II CRISPR RNA-guided endonuclease Cas9 [Treponemataceae bacterium]